MKTITVYGPGCARCKQTEDIVQRVVAEVGGDVVIEKVSDYQAIAQAGIMATPAVAIDGVVKVSGRIPKATEIKEFIESS